MILKVHHQYSDLCVPHHKDKTCKFVFSENLIYNLDVRYFGTIALHPGVVPEYFLLCCSANCPAWDQKYWVLPFPKVCLDEKMHPLASQCSQNPRVFTRILQCSETVSVIHLMINVVADQLNHPCSRRNRLGLLTNVQHCISYWNPVSFFELSPECLNLSTSESEIKCPVLIF